MGVRSINTKTPTWKAKKRTWMIRDPIQEKEGAKKKDAMGPVS
jgi:hypothetical protein